LEWNDGDVADIFMRTFEISYDRFGTVEHFPLIQGGAETLVNNQNRIAYVNAYINHFVYTSILEKFKAFQKGFYKVCGGKSLAMCRPYELELLICGKATDDDEFKKLEEGASYDDGYSTSHTIIKYLYLLM
jgi:ubiquitin-protein ligase E3 A